MANIKDFLNKIRTAVYGREVRGSLADGLEAINNEAEAATTRTEQTEQRQDTLEKKFNDEIANMTIDDPSSAEIVAARTNTKTGDSHSTIGERIDADYSLIAAQLAPIDAGEFGATRDTEVIDCGTFADRVVEDRKNLIDGGVWS
ncbi:hypothetical protein NIE88_07545 [Sporolactobacillus shoreicorticis]|uniref:Uncharacterized protein n=1 Tax=Sporolactobacillus shoreicorticis TaxID=1923877 RepID=A0ABW5S723_9BACL|nr:hypothetical protein [Sporolactobacillus shoreicorticis]MCO7125623.1 hypothetical protein [Sporolactobacillus shoreicorticis]